MHKPKELLVLTVVTLLAYGCPLQAIVAAFSLDERTVARWEREAGIHCAGEFTSTWSRPAGSSWGRYKPTSCG